MRVPIFLSILLIFVESGKDLTVLFIGSKYKLTEKRVDDRRKRILSDCVEQKLSCSVVDALHDFSTWESDPQGMWTIVPPLMKLQEISDWTLIAEDTSEIHMENFGEFSKNRSTEIPVFSGFGIQDKVPTIIHHFGLNAPDNFFYPLLSAGFILSKTAVENIRKLGKTENSIGFSIDAKFEFALLLHKYQNLLLEHDPTTFCCGSFSSSCLVRCPSFDDSSESSLQDSDIYVMIKTFAGHHISRIPVLQNTWTRGLTRLDFCSDKEDVMIPTIDLGVQNTDRGHCGKTWAILRRFLKVSGETAKWLLVADDDTLMSWKRLKKMLEEYDPEEKIIIGERYGFGFSFDGESGYDYPTGGSGMIFSRSAVESLLETCPSCAADTDPDDMTIGMCAVTSGIPIVHESRLHQARPQDYAPEYLNSPISFHKFTEVDPISVYFNFLAETEEFEENAHREL